MTLTFSLIMFLGVGLLALMGLMSLMREVIDSHTDDAPLFDDRALEQLVECHEAISQFAWRSRAHSQAPD